MVRHGGSLGGGGGNLIILSRLYPRWVLLAAIDSFDTKKPLRTFMMGKRLNTVTHGNITILCRINDTQKCGFAASVSHVHPTQNKRGG